MKIVSRSLIGVEHVRAVSVKNLLGCCHYGTSHALTPTVTMLSYVVSATLVLPNAFALMRAPGLAAIGLIALTASAHAVEQNALNPDASADNARAITATPDVAPAIGPIDTAPIEARRYRVRDHHCVTPLLMVRRH